MPTILKFVMNTFSGSYRYATHEGSLQHVYYRTPCFGETLIYFPRITKMHGILFSSTVSLRMFDHISASPYLVSILVFSTGD
jgi:hypothetical protein